MDTSLFICGAFLLFCFFMLWRNDRVYKYRLEILTRISKAADEDIREGRDWNWRYYEFHKIEYEQMFYKFWKPLDSFWKDKRFIESGKGRTPFDNLI